MANDKRSDELFEKYKDYPNREEIINLNFRLDDAYALLKQAHDKMDDANTGLMPPDDLCHWCCAKKYDAQGIIHDEDCVLVRIRAIKGILT